MRQTLHLIIYITVLILTLGCTGKGEGRGFMPQASEGLYTEKAAMDVYGTQPERALVIIDSAEIVGNLTEDRASLLRAKVFCLTCGEERLDTARQICEALLQSNSVQDAPDNREQVLDLLVTVSRKKHDNEQWLRWASEKADFCRQQGNMTEALRTEAEIGIILTHLGRQDEGMAKLDNAIRQLDGTRKFNETDACIIALKRKINVLQEQGCWGEIVAPAKMIIEKLNDYEQHPGDYHDGTIREPAIADVPGYCAFYRSQAYAFLANAYVNIGDRANARQNLTLFEQSQYGQTLDGRKMIAPTWCKLGDYDKMLAVYDEMEQYMGSDTICSDYAKILYDRAEAAYAQATGMAAANSSFFTLHSSFKKAYDYMSRHAALSQTLNDSLQASEAHEYATLDAGRMQRYQDEKQGNKSLMKKREEMDYAYEYATIYRLPDDDEGDIPDLARLVMEMDHWELNSDKGRQRDIYYAYVVTHYYADEAEFKARSKELNQGHPYSNMTLKELQAYEREHDIPALDASQLKAIQELKKHY